MRQVLIDIKTLYMLVREFGRENTLSQKLFTDCVDCYLISDVMCLTFSEYTAEDLLVLVHSWKLAK